MAYENLSSQQFRTMVQNVQSVYEATPAQVRDAGKNWYDNVHEAVQKGVRGTSTSVTHGAGLVAAVSPNMDWEKRNIDALGELHSLKDDHWKAIAGGDKSPVKGMSISQAPKSNLLKAHRILQGEHPDSVLVAPKTNSFFHNIDAPDTPGPVTIDGRAHDIARGAMQGWTSNRGISGRMVTPKGKETASYQRYQDFENVYRGATAAVNEEHGTNLQPHQMQAVTWEGGKHIERSFPSKSGKPRVQGPRREGQPYTGNPYQAQVSLF